MSTKVATIIEHMQRIAPLNYAAPWDNVGLLIGSSDWDADRIMLTIDLTDSVLQEAIDQDIGMIIAYHPPIFQPMCSLTDDDVTQRRALQAAQAGIAVYSPHTALDAAPDGVNDWLVKGLGEGDSRVLKSYQHLPDTEQFKIVTFCPREAADHVRNGLGSVGAGRIGDYSLCSFEIPGTGTFLGGQSTSPVVGEKGQLERVDELRLEMVCSHSSLALAIVALREFHPYEEPPIEIYALQSRPLRTIGEGRRAVLDQQVSLKELCDRIKKRLGVKQVRVAVADDAPRQYQTIGLCAGAGASLIDSAIEQQCEAFLTGEMRHHDVIDAQARRCTVILAGHTNTERGYLKVLRRRLSSELKNIDITVSRRDSDQLKVM